MTFNELLETVPPEVKSAIEEIEHKAGTTDADWEFVKAAGELLAAAKAASVWPVGWTEIRTNPGGNVVIYTENHEIAFQLMAWLRDRMKDTTPPEA